MANGKLPDEILKETYMSHIIGKASIKEISLIALLLLFSCQETANAKKTGDIRNLENRAIKEEGRMMKDNLETLKNVRLSIVYDNHEFKQGLKADWGFGCVVEAEEEVLLFDTGGDSSILLDNMEALKIDPKKIKTIVLSHFHRDHTGGLQKLLQINNNVEVFIPESFPDSFKQGLKTAGARIREIKSSIQVGKGLYSTGELGTTIIEQSLIINTSKGLIVMTGCAHPGIVDILKHTKALFDKKIYLALGGFHLAWASEKELQEIMNSFRELGVEKVGPCHCSGESGRSMFQEIYQADYIEAGVGRIIEGIFH